MIKRSPRIERIERFERHGTPEYGIQIMGAGSAPGMVRVRHAWPDGTTSEGEMSENAIRLQFVPAGAQHINAAT